MTLCKNMSLKLKPLTLMTQITLPMVKLKATSQEMSHTGNCVNVRSMPRSTARGCDVRRGTETPVAKPPGGLWTRSG